MGDSAWGHKESDRTCIGTLSVINMLFIGNESINSVQSQFKFQEIFLVCLVCCLVWGEGKKEG